MKDVFLYSSLGNKLEKFNPIVPGKVSMYVCGPTVYNDPHIGNMRPVVVFDEWRRLFMALDYQVTYVSNYTDVDDKIIKRAKELEISEKELTESVITKFRHLVEEVGALQPDFTPKPTVYMPEMISYINDLVQNESAYVRGGDVYFRVSKDESYGCLSGNTPEALMSGARIEVNSQKESPLDFALWKATDEGIRWSTPWSEGRPGWHTECCVMINSIFKDQNGLIDIHGGGFDLKFPHHENEIAQSEAHNHNHLANYWLHNGFINIDNEKMSKSLGNVLLAKDVVEQWGGMPLRIMILNTHYRAPLAFTEKTIQEADKNYKKICQAMKLLAVFLQTHGVDDLNSIEGNDEEGFYRELCNDLNTPNAFTILYNELKEANQCLRVSAPDICSIQTHFARIRDYLHVLGIVAPYPVMSSEDKDLYANYVKAKQEKDFAQSDLLRANLIQKGIL